MCCPQDFGLTNKQWMFCNEYIASYCNGTQAYLKLHPKVSNDTARSNASELLAKPNVKACVRKLLEEYKFNKQEIINQVVMELIATATGRADEETTIQNGNSIKKVNNKATNRDKNQARDMLLKLFGAYDTPQTSGVDNENEQMQTNVETINNGKLEGFDE